MAWKRCLGLFMAFNGAIAAPTPPKCSGDMMPGKCFHNLWEHTSSYNSGMVPGPTMAEASTQCCYQCERDSSPGGHAHCLGWTVLQVQGVFTCTQYDQLDVTVFRKPPKGGQCMSGVLHSSPPVIPPKPVKRWPKDAKNVLFLIADDMRPSIGPYVFDSNSNTRSVVCDFRIVYWCAKCIPCMFFFVHVQM